LLDGSLALAGGLVSGTPKVRAVGGAVHQIRQRDEESRIGDRAEQARLDSHVLVDERKDDEEERKKQGRAPQRSAPRRRLHLPDRPTALRSPPLVSVASALAVASATSLVGPLRRRLYL